MGNVVLVDDIIVLERSSSSSLSVDFGFALLHCHRFINHLRVELADSQGDSMSMSPFQHRKSLFQLVNDRLELPNVAVTPCDHPALRIDQNLVSVHHVPCMCSDGVPGGVAQWRSWPESHGESKSLCRGTIESREAMRRALGS
ncbi:hypothetical protein BCR37DRAFT_382818 [Protomyces lactucae-debilis]|uniref:Uncharacterized protein n=1 Tax=Protomyces lactucae-debilis TaxID=2754530 RepID=A0A1Y2F0G2_PROLT|nr:uncharacterized protein BCR37DRAFT_382818 [Protomyces lactucae-debilis]ORY77330.1 hypothetical protein BCR37DRAFT_382818 [Protomyces lactucae-debilis]